MQSKLKLNEGMLKKVDFSFLKFFYLKTRKPASRVCLGANAQLLGTKSGRCLAGFCDP